MITFIFVSQILRQINYIITVYYLFLFNILFIIARKEMFWKAWNYSETMMFRPQKYQFHFVNSNSYFKIFFFFFSSSMQFCCFPSYFIKRLCKNIFCLQQILIFLSKIYFEYFYKMEQKKEEKESVNSKNTSSITIILYINVIH